VSHWLLVSSWFEMKKLSLEWLAKIPAKKSYISNHHSSYTKSHDFSPHSMPILALVLLDLYPALQAAPSCPLQA
jgi:hypothetical protein